METTGLLTAELQPERSAVKYFLIGGVAVLLLLALSYGIYGCVNSITEARDQADSMVTDLHNQMAMQQWDQIYLTASKSYQESLDRQKSDLYFSSIDRKLGRPIATLQRNVFISTATNGTFIKAIFDTNFSEGDTAVETIVWYEGRDEQYRLAHYNIQSDSLLLK